MSFQEFELPPNRRGTRMSGRVASLTKTGMLTLTDEAMRLWSEPPAFVRLLFDPDRHAIALRPSSDPDHWKVRKEQNRHRRINIRSLLTHHRIEIPRTLRITVALEGGFLVLQLPEETRPRAKAP